MKLYATTTSERASKGQGGNDYLTITITNEDGENIAQVNVYNDKENRQILTTFVPLNCQEYTKDGNSKAEQVITKTRRYITGENFKGKKQQMHI